MLDISNALNNAINDDEQYVLSKAEVVFADSRHIDNHTIGLTEDGVGNEYWLFADW